MNTIILVQKNSHGRTKYLELVLNGATVKRSWGLIGSDKIQTTSNTYDFTNKNKANELTPIETATEDFNRLIDKKIKEGYIKAESLDNLPILEASNMDFEDLPVQFCCSKPYNKVTKVVLNRLLKNKKIKFFLKANGLCHYILITENNEVKIYTRRIDDHTAKYPKLVESTKACGFPSNTLLIAELVVDPEMGTPHMEGFKLMQSISRTDVLKDKVQSSVEQTLLLQEVNPVKAVVFNILFLDGEDLTKHSYDYVLDLFKLKLKGDLLFPKELEFGSYDEALTWAEINKVQYEGLVAWDTAENAEITYNGKPNRRACYKIKSSEEEDVVAYGFQEGTGAKQGKIGSLLIGKYNSDGTIVDFGKVGSGLKIKEGDCDIEGWQFPCVVAIVYDQRFPTGKYQFPRFIKKHEDKLPIEITINEEGL